MPAQQMLERPETSASAESRAWLSALRGQGAGIIYISHRLEELEEIALEEVTPKMRRAADAIKDDNLRYQFLLAAGSCLARKKKLK